MEYSNISKVAILLDQNKHAEAEKILKSMLAKDPNNVQFLSLLADVYLNLGNAQKADSIIDNAIRISPQNASLFYTKALIALDLKKLYVAESNINQAIRINPDKASYFALLAHINLERKQYDNALEKANRALSMDAENLLALNTRSTALIKLNRSEEAFKTIKDALREDPNNAFTHSNYAWGLLEDNQHKKALEHFREALKIDPNYQHAQSGMLEALKATNPVYRMFLRYAIRMSNLTAKEQWGILIVFFISYITINSIAKNNEAFKPYLTPIIIILALFSFSTWVIPPISNLFLRFNKYGNLLLDKKEKISSGFVAFSLLLFIVGISLYITFSDKLSLIVSFFGFTMILPFSVMLLPVKQKNSLLLFTIAMAIAGLIAIGMTYSTGNIFNVMTKSYIIGFIGFQWISNLMLIKESN